MSQPVPARTHPPSVSVIVPVHGDRGGLALVLSALVAQRYAGAVAVLVVDNGDNGDLGRLLPVDGLDVRVLRETAPGSYAARNAAVAVAEGEVLAFTDADCRPDADWLAAGVAALAAAGTPAFVGGRVLLEPAHPERPAGGELWDLVHGLRQDDYVRRGWAATANLLVAREVLDRVGPFNGRLRSGGDRDWGERATSIGVKAVYADAAVVRHPARRLGELQDKVVRVTEGWIARQRAVGRTPFETRALVRSAVPYLRSSVVASRRLEAHGLGVGSRARFLLVTFWLQYFRLAVQLRLLARRR